MEKCFRYIVMASVFVIVLIFVGLFAFQHHIYHSVNAYASQNYQVLNELKNNELIDNNQIDYTQNKTTEQYYNFLKSYYETQNNWLNYWLAIIGMLLTIMMIIIPYIFSRRWKDEKDELNTIKKDFNTEIAIAEDKLNRLDVNKVKQEFDRVIADKLAELNEMIDSATDEMWKNINDKQEGLILSIKRIILEDILKSGPDSDFLVDKITDKLTKDVEKIVDAKLEEADYERD